MTKRDKIKTHAQRRAAVDEPGATKTTEVERRAIQSDTIGKVAAVLSHESRNLLGALGTCVQVLRRNPHLSADDNELLAIMQSGADRLSEIITQFAHFHRAGPTRHSAVNLHEIIEETLARLRQDERCSTEIVVDRRFDPQVKHINADAEGLRRVLWELCLNGALAIGRQGRLEIATRRTGKKILITIRDSGPGVDAGLARDIFEPLFTTRTRAAGLGLAIARRIVEQHGGTVTLESERRGGASFAIGLPSGSPEDEKSLSPRRTGTRFKHVR